MNIEERRVPKIVIATYDPRDAHEPRTFVVQSGNPDIDPQDRLSPTRIYDLLIQGYTIVVGNRHNRGIVDASVQETESGRDVAIWIRNNDGSSRISAREKFNIIETYGLLADAGYGFVFDQVQEM